MYPKIRVLVSITFPEKSRLRDGCYKWNVEILDGTHSKFPVDGCPTREQHRS